MKYTHYLALGDSISIDLYPSLDMNSTRNMKVGAASLLNRSLKTMHNRDIEFMNLTMDGAMIRDIKDDQLPRARAWRGLDSNLLITLTAGGNDISFSAMKARSKDTWYETILPLIASEWFVFIRGLVAEFNGATIIVNTLYDPTEQTGTFGGHEVAGAWEDIAEQYSYGRRYLSEQITRYVKSLPANVIMTDIQKLFEGHGVSAAETDRWYWREFMIEPNAEGARQIAHRWMMDLHEHMMAQVPVTNIVRDLKEWETVTP